MFSISSFLFHSTVDITIVIKSRNSESRFSNYMEIELRKMVSKLKSHLFCLVCIMLISIANCATIIKKDNINIKDSQKLASVSDLNYSRQVQDTQLQQFSSSGSGSSPSLSVNADPNHSFLQPLISRGYEEDNKYEASSHGQGQYYHHSTHATTAGGYDSLTVVAATVFAVLGLLLFLQLLGVQTVRSAPSSWFPGPSDLALRLRVEDIPDILSKVAKWVEKLPSSNSANGNASGATEILKRTVRDVSEASTKFGLADWITAYNKDPVQYQYIRKLACQTLGKSELAQRSVESEMGKKLLSGLEYFLDDVSDFVETIEDVVGHPEKCTYITFINEDDGYESEENAKDENNLN